jgi:4-hydroxy-tetrahydrodipicolinate synthase
MNSIFSGVFSVLPTPFIGGRAIDDGSLRRVIDMYIAAGVDGVTALGVTSETSRLNDAERMHVLGLVMDHVRGRVPVVVGATADGLGTCLDYSRAAKERGASAVMISPPRMLKPNGDAIVRHYAAVAEQVDIDIVVQDYPPVSGFTMEPSLLARIAREVERVRAIKLEDPPTPHKTARILDAAGSGSLHVLGGLGGMYLIEELLAGASGVMTGFAYPEMLVSIVAAFRGGRVDDAARLFYGFVPLMRFEFQEGIGMAIRKEILRRRGAIDDASIRSPGSSLDDGTRQALDRLLAWMKDGEGAKWISA